jgi:hypothetical protein
MAEAAAWTQLAVCTTSASDRTFVALHHDQDPIIEVTLESVGGAVELLRWRMGDNAFNREEALRHVLRFVTASSSLLPNARTVQRLAERQWIALARERAAEVFRAIADGQRSTADLLESASEALSKLVEDTTTTASATVAAVIGVVALVAQNAGLLPGWLIVLATLVAIVGVGAVVASRWQRIDDQEQAVVRLQNRLRDDPLLPPEELNSMKQAIDDAKITSRAKLARQRILALGIAAGVVASLAAVWLVTSHTSSPARLTPTTTTTSPPTPRTASPAGR